jgi:tetratricopeptide (TPR) repeat protein
VLHDLLRAYAAEQAGAARFAGGAAGGAADGSADGSVDGSVDRHEGRPETERGAAEGRILDHYLHTCHTVSRLLDPAKNVTEPAAPRPGVQPERPAGYEEALAWVEAEHQVLLAAVAYAARHGYDRHAEQLPVVLETFLLRRGYWHDLAQTQRTALEVAIRSDDLTGQARAHHGLGRACALLGSLSAAQSHLSQALEGYQRLGDRMATARAHIDTGTAFSEGGRFEEALGHAQQARDLFRAADDATGYATALNNIGWNHIHLGNYPQAIACCEEALAAFGGLGDRYGEAAALDSLGYAHYHLGDYASGAARCQEAVAVFRELGDPYNEASVLIHVGDNLSAARKEPAAQDAWQRALVILEELDHPEARQVREKLRDAAGAAC